MVERLRQIKRSEGSCREVQPDPGRGVYVPSGTKTLTNIVSVQSCTTQRSLENVWKLLRPAGPTGPPLQLSEP